MTFDGIIPVSSLGFRSALIDAVAAMDFRSMPAPQLLARIKKTPGIKKEEIEDLGLQAWLESADKKIRKENVLEFIRQGGPKLVGIVKGAQCIYGAVDEGDVVHKTFTDVEEAIFFVEQKNATSNTPRLKVEKTFSRQTKYHKYQLPEGENYREILLTIPTSYKGSDEFIVKWSDGTESELWFSSRTDAQSHIDERIDSDGEVVELQLENVFKTKHWKESNVLVHIRLNDRENTDGQRVLFIEEIQSDWHQKGRIKGYQGASTSQIEVVQTEDGDWAVIEDGETWLDLLDEKTAREEAARIDAENIEAADGRRVPDAPFKKSWPILAVKRVLHMAAEQGYDAVAWTPGKLQVARYDLSEQLSRIEYAADGTGWLHVFDLDEKEILSKPNVSAEELADHIGKDASEKLLSAEIKTDRTGWRYQSINGEGLKLGGDGMIAFYDQILPRQLNSHLKRFHHGAKVGTSTICIPSSDTAVTGAEIKAAGFERHPLCISADPSISQYTLERTDTGEELGTFDSHEEAHEACKAELDKLLQRGIYDIWTLPISQELRTEILQGQSLYQMPLEDEPEDDDMEM